MKRLAFAALSATLAMTNLGEALGDLRAEMPIPSSEKTRRGGRTEHSNRHTGARKQQRAAKKRRGRK